MALNMLLLLLLVPMLLVCCLQLKRFLTDVVMKKHYENLDVKL